MDRNAPKDKQQLILLAARKRFAHFGFSKVTMDEVAVDMGMAKPSLYYYYPTKGSLFRAVIAQEQQQFAQDVERFLSKDMTASRKLKEYVEIRLRLFKKLANLNSLGFNTWSEARSLSGDLFRNLEAQALKAIQHILISGKQSGEFPGVKPHETAKVLVHALHGLRLRLCRGGEGKPVTDETHTELKRESAMFVDILIQAIQHVH